MDGFVVSPKQHWALIRLFWEGEPLRCAAELFNAGYRTDRWDPDHWRWWEDARRWKREREALQSHIIPHLLKWMQLEAAHAR